MFRLPICNAQIELRLPTGAEDLILLESRASEPSLAATLMTRLATSDTPIDWLKAAVTDLEAAMLLLRQAYAGDLLRTDVVCTAPGCRSRVDVAFRISEYLAHARPRTVRNVGAADAEGWFRLRDAELTFRAPTVEDQIAIAGLAAPHMELAKRCIRPQAAAGRSLMRVQKAMECVAPCLSDWVQGKCPECHAALSMYFDVYRFVLKELRARSASIYRDVHLLAERYHWPESRILKMPCVRRQH